MAEERSTRLREWLVLALPLPEVQLGLGRIAFSENEAPNLYANLV